MVSETSTKQCFRNLHLSDSALKYQTNIVRLESRIVSSTNFIRLRSLRNLMISLKLNTMTSLLTSITFQFVLFIFVAERLPSGIFHSLYGCFSCLNVTGSASRFNQRRDGWKLAVVVMKLTVFIAFFFSYPSASSTAIGTSTLKPSNSVTNCVKF